MSESMCDVFFYGLFMDEKVLRARGVHPRDPRRAVVPGYRLRIGRRAILVPGFGAQAMGMVFTLTDRETTSLYAEPGLEAYRPVRVMAHFEDGSCAPVVMYHHDEVAEVETDPEYAAALRSLLDRLGFREDPSSD